MPSGFLSLFLPLLHFALLTSVGRFDALSWEAQSFAGSYSAEETRGERKKKKKRKKGQEYMILY